MSLQPQMIRLAAALPEPAALAPFGPFTALGRGPYGIAECSEGNSVRLQAHQALAKVFAAGATAGMCLVPRVRAVFFDMDATVVNEESLVEVAALAGLREEVKRITDRAMAGELDFGAALAARIALLAGRPASLLDEVAEKLTLMRGIEAFVAYCREVGVRTFLVSGGFVPMAVCVQRKVGFDGTQANTLEVQGGRLTGRLRGGVVDAAEKRRFLLATCARYGWDPATVAAVGDGANDLLMLQTAGVAVGHRPKPVLLPHVHALNSLGDHAFLAPLLFGCDLAPPLPPDAAQLGATGP